MSDWALSSSPPPAAFSESLALAGLSGGGSSPYQWHVLGRQLSTLLQIPLLSMQAFGQYRFNYALHAENPHDPLFNGGPGRLYRGERGLFRAAPSLFLPRAMRQGTLSAEDRDHLRRSGASLQRLAGLGLQAPLLFRFSANLRALEDPYFSAEGSPRLAQAAVSLDLAALLGNLSDAHIYNRGLSHLRRGSETRAVAWLRLSHRVNLMSSVLQMAAGGTRLALEIERHRNTGRLNASTALYGALDCAGGFAGAAHSLFLLKRAGETLPLKARNNVLMGLTPLPRNLQWGLRGVHVLGAAVGFALSGQSLLSARADSTLSPELRRRKMISGFLGMVGSGLMISSSLMVHPASAPLAALLLTAGLAVTVGQAFYEY